jgi:hypothetical protein
MASDFQKYLSSLLKSKTSTILIKSGAYYESTNVFLGTNATTANEAIEFGRKAQAQLKDFRDTRTTDQIYVASLDATIQGYNASISTTTDPTAKAALIASRAPLLVERDAYTQKIDELTAFISAIEKFNLPINPAFVAKSDASIAKLPIKVITKANLKKVTYNVGSVREAYFSGREEFLRETLIHPGNTPLRVDNAANLWAGGLANKGMIQTWSPPDPETTASGAPENQSIPGEQTKLTPYGFQFQYNPTNISMVYSGTPSVDMQFEASGGDKFNFVGTGVTQSTIGFQILLNRVYDMKYYGVDGKLKPGADKSYSPIPPTLAEQKEIYNKGTMYDMEYLLRTLLGVTMKSYLRDNYLDGQTADMGFVTAIPVELHLGQNLRYLVWVNQISINHVLFNERMVPLFSTVDISCQRMPDFAQKTVAETERATAINWLNNTDLSAFDWDGPGR